MASRDDPYLSPWGRVGEMVAMVWPLKAVARPPSLKSGERSKPIPMVWAGLAEGESSGVAESFLTGRIGVPNTKPVRIRGVVGASWSEDFDRTSMDMNVTFHDPFGEIRSKTEPGTWMYLALPMDGYLWEIGLFYIWERSVSDFRSKEITVFGLDMISRLDRIGGEDRIYRKTHPWKIAKEIGDRFSVPITVEKVGARQEMLQFQNKSPYEQIRETYDADTAQTSTRWRIRAIGERIWIYQVKEGMMDRSQPKGRILFIEPSENQVVGNMMDGVMRESLDEKRTIVYARGTRRVNPEDPNSMAFQFPVVVGRSADINKYGPLIENVDLTNAGSMTQAQVRAVVVKTLRDHDDLTREGTYTLPGHPAIRAGHWIGVYDPKGTGLAGMFYTSKVTHTISGSTIRSQVTVSPNIASPKVTTVTETTGKPAVKDFPAPAFGAPPAPGTPGSPYAGPPAPPSSTRTAPGFNEAEMIQIINRYIAGTDWHGGGSVGRSPLEGLGAVIVRECKGKMDPRLCVAIGVHEGRLGTVSNARTARNTWGMLKKGGGLIAFPSWEAGIKAFVANLCKPGGYYVNLNTVSAISRRYAPIGASNDPMGLNRNWVTGVTTAMGEMGGPTSAYTSVKYKP